MIVGQQEAPGPPALFKYSDHIPSYPSEHSLGLNTARQQGRLFGVALDVYFNLVVPVTKCAVYPRFHATHRIRGIPSVHELPDCISFS